MYIQALRLVSVEIESIGRSLLMCLSAVFFMFGKAPNNLHL